MSQGNAQMPRPNTLDRFAQALGLRRNEPKGLGPQAGGNWAEGRGRPPIYNRLARNRPAQPQQNPSPSNLPPAVPLGNPANYHVPTPEESRPPSSVDLPAESIGGGHTAVPLPFQMNHGAPTQPLPPNSNAHRFLNPGIQGTPIWDQRHTMPGPGGQQPGGGAPPPQGGYGGPPPPQGGYGGPPPPQGVYGGPAPGTTPIYDQFSTRMS